MMTALHQRFWDDNLARLPVIWQAGLRHPRIVFVDELVGRHRRFHPTIDSPIGQAGVTQTDDKSGLILFTTRTYDDETFLHEATHALIALVDAWDPQRIPTADPDVLAVFAQARSTKRSLDAFLQPNSAAYSLTDPDEFLAQLVGMGLTEDDRRCVDDGVIHPFLHPIGEALWPGSSHRLLAAEGRFTDAIAHATASLGAPKAGGPTISASAPDLPKEQARL